MSVLAAALAGLAAAVLATPGAAGAPRLERLAPGPGSRGRAAPGRSWASRLRRREDLLRERERAVEACAALAGELRAGRPPELALDAAAEVAVGATGRVLRGAVSAAAVGGDPAEVLAHGAEATGAPGLLRGLSACWALCSTSGSGLAAAVEQLERSQRDGDDRRRAVQAELAGPRTTARMLAVLPVVGLALAAGLGADPVGFLLTTPLGLVCLGAGLLLDGLGLVWTGRLVARASAVA